MLMQSKGQDLMSAPSDGMDDLIGDMLGASVGAAVECPEGMIVVLDAQQLGLQVEAKVDRGNGFAGEGVFMWLRFRNCTQGHITSVDLRLNRNSYGLVKSAVSFDARSAFPQTANAAMLHSGVPGMPLQPQGCISCVLKMEFSTAAVSAANPSHGLLDIQAAIKVDTSPDHGYFNMQCPLYAVMSHQPTLEKRAYMQMWKEVSSEEDFTLNTNVSNDQVISKLEASHFLIIHQRDSAEGTVLYTCAVTEAASEGPVWCLATLTVSAAAIDVKVKCENSMIAPFTKDMFTKLFGAVSSVTDLEGLF